jgi:hypothetical protein
MRRFASECLAAFLTDLEIFCLNEHGANTDDYYGSGGGGGNEGGTGDRGGGSGSYNQV